MILSALALAAATPVSGLVAARVDAVATGAGLAGEVLVAKGDRVLLDRGYGPVAPGGTIKHRAGERWRLASITKQVTAAQIVAAYQDELEGLDAPLPGAPIWPTLRGVTLRQLLTHHSGLPNPDTSTLGAGGVPSAYLRPTPPYALCTSRPATPGAAFSYNNCDYLIAGGFRARRDWPAGMTLARPGERGVPGFVGGKPEPAFELASYGAAGGLMGTARAIFDFDRSLMTGKFLPPAALAELWKPEGNGSYQALGQWVFPGQLKGCAKPKRIVQRDGEIFGVQARNFIFPDDDLVVIVFTNRSSDDFALGEVWEGKGFVYDLLSAAACP